MSSPHRPTMDIYGELFEDPDEDMELYGVVSGPEIKHDRRTYQSVGIERDRRTDDVISGKTKGPYSRDDGIDGIHAENLFDENEDTYGNLVNDSTGERFDNSTVTDETLVLRAGGQIIELSDGGAELPDLVDAWIERHEKEAQSTENEGREIA